jgi:hypothetical protein
VLFCICTINDTKRKHVEFDLSVCCFWLWQLGLPVTQTNVLEFVNDLHDIDVAFEGILIVVSCLFFDDVFLFVFDCID